jgi:hypothetical protein
MALGIPLILAAGAVLLLFQYGFMVILFKLYSGRRAILGDLLCGIRNIKRMFGSACLFILIGAAAALVSSGVFLAAASVFPAIKVDNLQFVSIFVVLYLVLLILAVLPFAFAWFEMYLKPEMTTIAAFKSSARLLKGKKAALAALILRSAGLFLLSAGVIYALNISALVGAFLYGTAGETGAAPETAPGFLRAVYFLTNGTAGTFLNLAYYAATFVAVIKAGYALTAFYTGLASPPEYRPGPSALPQVIELPPPESEAGDSGR